MRGLRRSVGALALAVLAACASSAVPVSPLSTDPGTRVAEPLPMPRPARARREAAVALNATCEACHADVAEEWRSSLHRRANVEPAYRRAFEIEPLPFCRGCHAPEARPEELESRAESELGVGCVTCHVTGDDERVLAAPRAHGAADEGERAPHALVRDARFTTAEACASCHEFAFPGLPGRHAGELMQSTVREHAASPAKDRSCADCHMPSLPGARRSHAFVASRSPDVVRSAVEVSASRLDGGRVRVELAPRDPGHAFPTGDLFRRVEISVEVLGPDHLVLRRELRYLARHFELARGAVGRRLVRDDRVHHEARVVELDTSATDAQLVAYRVAYQRVAHPLDAGFEAAEIEGEIVLSEGLLAAGAPFTPPARQGSVAP